MVRRFSVISWTVAAAIAVALSAVPAAAQLSSAMRGKVVDEQGKPVPDATVTIESIAGKNLTITLTTDKNGGFLRAGIVAPDDYKVTAKKDKLIGIVESIHAEQGIVTNVPTITIKAAPAGMGMDAKQIAEYNEKQKALGDKYKSAQADLEAGNYDLVLTKMDDLIKDLPTCGQCYEKKGEAYLQMKKLDDAEAAFKKAIELDGAKPTPTSASAYGNLATLYNQEQKFDQASEMNKKAAEIGGGAGGGGSATAAYNDGVILWNQGKAPEAAAKFEEAVKADPKMADAYYQLGMAYVSQGKNKEAIAALQQYLVLDPKGKNADTAKAILEQIKG